MTHHFSSTTELIAEMARRRGIAVTSFATEHPQVIRLEHAGVVHFVNYSNTELQNVPRMVIVSNKALTTRLLREGGFPVPAEEVATSMDEVEDFLTRYQRIVIKPICNTGGSGVTPNVTTVEEAQAAFEEALVSNTDMRVVNRVVCQEHLTGGDFRVLVINKEHVFVAQRVPAHVVGDGVQTVEQLIENRNRGIAPEKHIQVTEQAKRLLVEQALTLESIPTPQQRVELALVANTHAGGTIHDVTATVAPEVIELGRAVAQYMGIPVLGLDCISPDITTTPGHIIELNATPDLRYPEPAVQEAVAQRFLDMLFPASAP